MICTISIHALREEGDLRICCFLHDIQDFYPRPPRGGRPIRYFVRTKRLVISIHALREEGDVDAGKATIMANLFLSTPSARRATFRHPCHQTW